VVIVTHPLWIVCLGCYQGCLIVSHAAWIFSGGMLRLLPYLKACCRLVALLASKSAVLTMCIALMYGTPHRYVECGILLQLLAELPKELVAVLQPLLLPTIATPFAPRFLLAFVPLLSLSGL
jgi:hypothetical protein